jgi:hypothetical protein
MSKTNKPIRKDIEDELWKVIFDFPITIVIYFLWEKFGLSIALPSFIFILIVVAPAMGLERLSLIAITFFGLSVEMAKESKFSEALIFLSVVAISVGIDELLRNKSLNFPIFKLPILPKSPILRDLSFSLAGAILFYSYSIYEYQSGSSSFFSLVGQNAIKFSTSGQWNQALGFNKDTLSGILLSNPLFIVWLSTLPGAMLSGLLFYAKSMSELVAISFYMILFMPLIAFARGLGLGLIIALVLGLFELGIGAIFWLSINSNPLNDAFIFLNWTLAHVICAWCAIPGTLEIPKK